MGNVGKTRTKNHNFYRWYVCHSQSRMVSDIVLETPSLENRCLEIRPSCHGKSFDRRCDRIWRLLNKRHSRRMSPLVAWGTSWSMGVSMGGYPKSWMVFVRENPQPRNGWWYGVPLFQEILKSEQQWFGAGLAIFIWAICLELGARPRKSFFWESQRTFWIYFLAR